MKLFLQIIFIIFLILTIVIGCVSEGRIVHPIYQRTNDVYNAATCVYHNKSIPFTVTFPKSEWNIYVDLNTVPVKMFPDIEKHEKESGGEIAMVGSHISHQMAVFLLIDHGISGLTSAEYLKVVQDINKEDLAGAIENFTSEKEISDQTCTEIEYQVTFEENNTTMNTTIRELYFLKNNYACRFRIVMNTVLYQSFKIEVEKILDTISFS